MNIQEQINAYFTSLPEAKRQDLQTLHNILLEIMPACKLWFWDGTDDKGKIVSNPNVGYGFQILKYADGKTKDFYQIGLSPNTTGVSVYLIGIEDKQYLAQTYGARIGKASVTGYCIKFKKLQDINIEILKEAIQHAVELTTTVQ